MRVLHIGSCGNLGRRLVPALLVHDHSVIAFVRSPDKLRQFISPELVQGITIVQGDAFDTDAVAEALREHRCDAIVNTAGSSNGPYGRHTLGKLVASITSAAVSVGKDRGVPLRAWIIGGMGSLDYPGTPFKIQDYMPALMTEHHRGTEEVMKRIPTMELKWSLLCVAMMKETSTEIVPLSGRQRHKLLIGNDTPPSWIDHWIRYIPFVGVYLNLIPTIASYTTPYEEVAGFIAEDLEREDSNHIGRFVGFKAAKQEDRSRG